MSSPRSSLSLVASYNVQPEVWLRVLNPQIHTQIKKPEDVETERARPVSGKRVLTIKFNADVSDRMPWKFAPQQVS